MQTIPLNSLPTTDPIALLNQLQKGQQVSLVHQEKVIGVIQPIKKRITKFDAAKFERFANDLNLPKTTPAQRAKRYRAHLTKKYGKALS